MKIKIQTALPLALLTLLGLLMRLPYMTRSFWFDETFTANQVTFTRSVSDIIAYLRISDVHPPLHYLLYQAYSRLFSLHAWPDLTPGIEWKLRLPSLLLGLAAIPLSYALARQFGRYAAWAAAITASLSPFTVGESVEARMYSALTLLAVSSWLLLLRGGRYDVWWAGLLGALGIWQQVLYAIVLLTQGIYLLVTQRRARDILSFTIFPLSFVVWVPILMHTLLQGGAHASLRAGPEFTAPLIYSIWTGQNKVLTLLGTGLLLLGVWRALEKRQLASVVRLTLLAPAIWLISAFAFNLISMRYVGMFTPGIGLLLGLGVQQLASGWRSHRPLLGVTGLLVVVVLAANPTRTVRVMSEPWREYAAWLSPRLQEGDQIATTESGRLISLLYYLRPVVKVSNIAADGTDINQLDAHRTWLFVLLFGNTLHIVHEKQFMDWLRQRMDNHTAHRFELMGRERLFYLPLVKK